MFLVIIKDEKNKSIEVALSLLTKKQSYHIFELRKINTEFVLKVKTNTEQKAVILRNLAIKSGFNAHYHAT